MWKPSSNQQTIWGLDTQFKLPGSEVSHPGLQMGRFAQLNINKGLTVQEGQRRLLLKRLSAKERTLVKIEKGEIVCY